MKKATLFLVLSFALLLLGSSAQAVPEQQADLANPLLVYELTENNEAVIFLFDERVQRLSSVESVFIPGTFNQWAKSGPEWEMNKVGDRVWRLVVPVEKISVPGNSGYAEFKFLVNGKGWVSPLLSTPPGYTFKENNIIVIPQAGESLDALVEAVIANENLANTPKMLADFDPDDEGDREMIANFRLVPGTSHLFRSYNPTRATRDYDSEVGRLEYVNQFVEDRGIKSIIAVSGEYEEPPKYNVSEYIRRIVDKGNFFASKLSYSFVYYESDSVEFARIIAEIAEFIIEPRNEAPFLVHCNAGTDRTGVVSAVLASFCGATWEEISIDFQKSNQAGIEEYRSIRLLQYSFENLLKQKLAAIDHLGDAVSGYFMAGGYLSSEQIKCLRDKLM